MMQVRLTTITAVEMSEAVDEVRRLGAEMREAMEDGIITPVERTRLLDRLDSVNRETREALVASEEADYVEAEYEYRRKVGMTKPLHQYLREKRAGVEALGGLTERRGLRLVGRATKDGVKLSLHTAQAEHRG